MSAAEPLYVFLHIPKCAGTSFTSHVKCNLAADEHLTVSANPKQRFDTREEVDAFVSSLPAARRDKVRLVMGHGTYFGIHEHFGRPAKYLTFLREPVEQAISQYNFIVRDYAMFARSSRHGWPVSLPERRSDFTFARWSELFETNSQTATVLNYLVDGRSGTLGQTRMSTAHVEQAKRILDQFYFVGLTENFEDDSCFLFHELGFTKRIAHRINETPHQDLIAAEDFVDEVAGHMTLDQQLYRHAVALNADFRARHGDYAAAVAAFRARALPVLPLRVMAMETARRVGGLSALLWLWRLKHALTD